jgi:PAS domain-containing protein
MTEASEKQFNVSSMLVGMLVMLVVVGLVWGVVHLADPGDDPPATAPAAGAVAVVEDDVTPGADVVAESPRATDADLQAKVDASVAALDREAADRKAADALQGEKALTPEELEEKRRQEEAKREAMRQREIAFMEDSFDDMKPKLMAIIDDYFEKPADERPEYLGEAMKELFGYMRQQREAAGLSGMPRGGPGKGHWFQVANERMTDEEKGRLKMFTNDIMQMQMAKMRAMMDTQLKTPPPPTPEDPDDIRLR